MVPIHPVVLEKKFVLHISHWVAMLTYVHRWWPSWIFNRSKKYLVSSLQWSKNHWMDWNHSWQKCSWQGSDQLLLLFVPIGYPIWLPGAIIASDWLKFQRIHTVVLEKKFVIHISHWVAMLTYVPRWWPSWIFNRSKKKQHLVSSLQWSFIGPCQVLLLFVLTVLRSRWLLLLKIEISSIVHCCFSISQNELKF
jgi:branched-subunit amino acid transport protein AzlD